VPNVVNQTAAEAQAILRQDGFNVQTNITPAPASEMVQPGTVYNQNPAANAVEPKGTLIQIFVEPQTTSSPTDTGSPTDTTSPTSPPTSPTDTPTTTPTGGATPGAGP
jgi:beta-lactam-binding protein with PASTA domain